jgi:hypothetical protein
LATIGPRMRPSITEITEHSYATWLQDDPLDERKAVLNTPVNRIFILGAGASVPYGLPTLKNLSREMALTLSVEDRAVFLRAIFECFNVNIEQVENSLDFEELLNRIGR